MFLSVSPTLRIVDITRFDSSLSLRIVKCARGEVKPCLSFRDPVTLVFYARIFVGNKVRHNIEKSNEINKIAGPIFHW